MDQSKSYSIFTMSSNTTILSGKKVIVIGGSSGIGRSVAAATLSHGASVVIASSSQDKVNIALGRLKQGVPPQSNVTVTGQVINLKDFDVLKAFLTKEGPFDHLACPFASGPANVNFPEQDIDLASSQSFFEPVPGWGLVSGLAGAIESSTRGLAIDLKPIRCPGLVDTELFASMPEDIRKDMFGRQEKTTPVGHIGKPEELAEAYLFAMKCTYLTGQVLVVDGGATLGLWGVALDRDKRQAPKDSLILIPRTLTISHWSPVGIQQDKQLAPSVSMQSTTSAAACSLCSHPIYIPTPDVEFDSQSISSDIEEIDSIRLPNCGHTFRWTCWASYEIQSPTNRPLCPSPNCGAATLTYPLQSGSSSNAGKLLVTLYNEGGISEGFDLGQALDDERYYDSHPDAKLARAFRSMVSEGDLDAAQEIMISEEWKEMGLSVDCLDEREEGATGGLTSLVLALGRGDEETARTLISWGAKTEGLMG
ncbi:Enoyl-(Acyl carrier protein) reductase, partial [Rhizoctonia solani]